MYTRGIAVAAAVVFFLALTGHGQVSEILFPKKSFGGFAEFDIAPPHNEWDLNRCSPAAGSIGGRNTECAAFARSALGGHLEFKPLDWFVFKRLYVFAAPRFFFGDNVPQTRYTWSFDPIGVMNSYGAYFDLPRNFQVRLAQQAKMAWLGRYGKNLGPADLGGDGPFGQNMSIGVRYNFGTFTQQRHE
jgi:hypothetical protein